MFLVFYFFCLLIIFSSFLVISSANPVYSVLFLILIYVLSTHIFFILGSEFLAILFFVIYVGAVSILFLFVVMLLHLRNVELFSTLNNYFPVSSFVGLFLFFNLFYLFTFDFVAVSNFAYIADNFVFHN
jgi:NADH-quinone oxidoreductase subunit J